MPAEWAWYLSLPCGVFRPNVHTGMRLHGRASVSRPSAACFIFVATVVNCANKVMRANRKQGSVVATRNKICKWSEVLAEGPGCHIIYLATHHEVLSTSLLFLAGAAAVFEVFEALAASVVQERLTTVNCIPVHDMIVAVLSCLIYLGAIIVVLSVLALTMKRRRLPIII